MSTQEGVIKYRCDFTPAPPLPYEELRELNVWRRLMFLTRLIGQDPDRYGGYGYGNISRRLDATARSKGQHPFIITGSQTGGKPELGPPWMSASCGFCMPIRRKFGITPSN